MKKILFLCTGNYYRSRTAEELFNHYAQQQGLEWQADSLGLAEDITATRNPGPISVFALEFLEKAGVSPKRSKDFPRSLTLAESKAYDFCIALDETEHRPMIERRFPDIPHLIYWKVPDVDKESPESALKRIQTRVLALVESFSGHI